MRSPQSTPKEELMLTAALHYAELGLSVIPIHGIEDGKCTCGSESCNKPGKHPRSKWKGSSTIALTPAEVRHWWTRFPNSNIGIVTGEISGIAVIDVDGEEGIRSLEKVGLTISDMPETPTARTGGGGYHLLYRMPEGSNVKTMAGILPKVDIRANGGMIVAPPSLHVSGKHYEWIEGKSIEDLDPADFDFSKLTGEKKAEKPKEISETRNWYEQGLKGSPPGDSRNVLATKLAGRYLSLGLTDKEVGFFIRSWNKVNNPPMEESELSTILKSIIGRDRKRVDQSADDDRESVSRILKMELKSVKRITGDDPQFVLLFEGGACTMTITQLLSAKLFQESVASATKVVVKKHSDKTVPTHDRLVQMIMNCADDVDAGAEATNVGEMSALLKDFTKTSQFVPDTDKGDEVPVNGSFRSDHLLWIHLADLVRHASHRWSMKVSLRNMAQKLRALGVDRRVFSLVDGSERNMWGIDTEALGGSKDEEVREKHE